MDDNSDTKRFNFKWNIDHRITPESWLDSPQYSCSDINVGFNISLKKQTFVDQHGTRRDRIKIRVRKNDLRAAKAIITITQTRLRKVIETTPQGVSRPMYQSSKLELAELEVNDWEEFCIFDIDNFENHTSYIFPRLKMTLSCEIVWYGFVDENSEKSLQKFVPQLLLPLSDTFSDVVIVVDDKEIPTHKVILSIHSPYFHKMLTTEMENVNENRIKIENFSFDVIFDMLQFFYTEKTRAKEDVEAALKMMEVARMYQISKLKDICQATFLKNIKVDNVLSILNLADDNDLVELRDVAIEFMVVHKDDILKLEDLEPLCHRKPSLMFRYMCAMGNK